MNGVNKVILLGNLGMDPEVKALESGTKVAKLRLATTERFKNRDGERQERTEWHNVDLWGRQAEVAEQYLSKGDSVFIEGKIQTDQWQDKEGNNRYFTKVRGLSMTMVGSKSSVGENNAESSSQTQESGSSKEEKELSSEEEGGDDLPF